MTKVPKQCWDSEVWSELIHGVVGKFLIWRLQIIRLSSQTRETWNAKTPHFAKFTQKGRVIKIKTWKMCTGFYWTVKKEILQNMEFEKNLTLIDSRISFNLPNIQNILNDSFLSEFDINEDSTNVTALQYEPYEKRLSTYIMPTVFTLIFLIGVVGNGCLILIFFRHKSMRNTPNTWVSS